MPDVSLNGIEFTIKGSTDGASSSIDKLIQKLGNLQNALGKSDGIKKFANSLNALRKALDGIKGADIKSTIQSLKQLGEISKSLQDFANISKSIASFARALAALAKDPEKILDVAQALNILGSVDLTNLAMAEGALRALADAVRSVGRGSNSANVGNQASMWSKFVKAIKPVGKMMLKGIALPFTRAYNSASDFVKSIGGVVGGFKRILGYRLIRSIIKEITQAFGEGIKNLYGWSKAMGGATMRGKTFAETMDGLATSSLYFKNSLGAMVAPIISALAPAIDFIIDKVVALINVINQLFALLGGATSWNKAIRKATEYEEATGGAGAAAKEAMRYLAPFDELNVLPDDKNRGGGGGGGTDFSGMFEEQTEFLEGLKDFTDRIKAAISAGDWQGLGTLLGEKVNELIGKIDFAGIGAKVGEKINAWFTTKYWTLETINFHTIGQNIATFLNNMLYEIDFDTLGRTITQPFTNLGDLIIGALETVNWGQVGEKIKDFIKGAFSQIGDFLDKYDWTEVGTKLFDGLNDFFSGLDPIAVLTGAVEFAGKLASALFQIIQGFLLGGKSFIDDSGVEWKFDVNGRLIKVEDKVPKKQKTLDVTGKFDKTEDALTDTDKTLDVKGKLTSAVDATRGSTTIAAVAEVVEAYDASLVQPYIGAIAALQRWEKANGFDSTISDMVANFMTWSASAGFGRQVSDMIAVFTAWKKDNPTAFNTLTDMVASFKSHMKANGFPNTIQGIVAGFASWVKEDPTRFNKITGMIANLASWAKANGFSDTITGFTAALSTYLKQFDDPTINAVAAIIEAFDWTGGGNYVDAIADIIQANPALASDPLIQAIAEILDVWIDPSTYAVIPGYVDTEEDEPYVYIPPAGAGGGGARFDDEGWATGGVFSNGFWRGLPKFASGGLLHGSMFVAGEAGPELVGHIGGRTEVLNRSQIASTMYASMNSALRGFEPNEDGVSEDSMYRAFRRALDETDFGGDIELDGDTLYRAMVTRNNRNTRATGVNAFA